MSLSSILSIANTGLLAAQTGIGTVSDNIANVNTPGYVRKIVDQSSVAIQGTGVGVSTSGVTRAANTFLQNAGLSATAGAGAASVVSDTLNQAQALLGDPTSTTGYFSSLNQVFSDFAAAANDPASTVNSIQAVGQVTQFLSQSQSVAQSLSDLSSQADHRIDGDVTQVNSLLGQIDSLNSSINASAASGGDVTNAQNAQSTLINQLAALVDVKVGPNGTGGVVLRTTSGQSLVGPQGAASIAYQGATQAASQMVISQPGGGAAIAPMSLTGGEIKGLLDLRNTSLPNVQGQLSEYVTQAVNAINLAHNASTSFPPPAQLTGANTGLDLPTAISGFSGVTNVAIVDSTGHLQTQVQIDFGAQTMSVNGVPAGGFTASTFLSSLNSALSGLGTANFSNGALSISAAAPGTGVAIADDPTTPSLKGGRGFSAFFGLNNLITSPAITNYQTGLAPTDANGFTPGDTITLRLTGANNTKITDLAIPVPAGGTVQNLIDALNAPVGGVGLYGQFNLDGAGTLTFVPSTPGATTVSVVTDSTSRGAGGPSISQLFGLGQAQRISRIATYSVRPDIAANPATLATAQLDLFASAGQPVISPGDGSGALALSKAGSTQMAFAAAGTAGALTTTVSQYAAQFAGALGTVAAAADSANTNATAVQSEANARRQSVEGVNMDQELINLTTYQQAYSASARLVTATTAMFNALQNM
jgi:flagellar hook-associated protein 1 FlgK